MSLNVASRAMPTSEIAVSRVDWPRIIHRYNLSPRELQVVQRSLQGKPIRQISDELDVAPGTVKTYLARIRAKLGVKKRQHLTVAVLIAALGHPAQ